MILLSPFACLLASSKLEAHSGFSEPRICPRAPGGGTPHVVRYKSPGERLLTSSATQRYAGPVALRLCGLFTCNANRGGLNLPHEAHFRRQV